MNKHQKPLKFQDAPLKHLVSLLQQMCAEDPLQLSQAIVLLPSRRAKRQFIEELHHLSPQGAFILPQISTLRDWLFQKNNPSSTLPSPVSHFERELHFINLLKSYVREESQAIHFAESLTDLYDEFILAEISLERINKIVPEEFAIHWQENLKYLEVLKNEWPILLKKLGRSDPCVYFKHVLQAQIDAWNLAPPQTVVIAAALDTHIPIVMRLNNVIEQLPKGKVYLDHSFEASEETIIPLFSENSEKFTQKLKLGEFSSLEEEARVIAILMREQLEDPHKTVALVTPSRSLAQRVNLELSRWDLNADDSYGQSLYDAPLGTFLRLSLEGVLKEFESIPLLSLLKHPYTAQTYKKYVGKLELQYLRGKLFVPNISYLLHNVPRGTEIHTFLNALKEWSVPLKNLLSQKSILLIDLLRVHLDFVEILSQNSLEQQRGYQEFIEHFKGLERSLTSFTIKGSDYPFILKKLLAQVTLRPTYGTHPRLSIWGPLEAQLQAVDCMIIGGMNEKNWPGYYLQSSWLNDHMRGILGLQTRMTWYQTKKRFWCDLLKAPEIILTRAIREDGQIEATSRWWLALVAKFKAKGDYEKYLLPSIYKQWAACLDSSSEQRILSRPAPCPPLEARPRTLSVTQIETWIRDPYSIYAREILNLKPLLSLEPSLGPALFGVMIHKILEEFYKQGHDIKDPQAYEMLCTLGKNIFGDSLNHPVVSSFWWTRFNQLITWFIEIERASDPLKTFVEVQGELFLEGPYKVFKLKATADRIDINAEGVACVIDYKTGRLPSRKEIEQGIMLQLPLEAAILQKGGFEGLEAQPEIMMRYMHLSGGQPPGTLLDLLDSDLVEKSLKRLQDMIIQYDNPQTSYPSCPDLEIAPAFSPYHHLSRIQEWQRR